MKMTRLSKSLSFILCIVLIAAMALLTTGCGDSTQEQPEKPSQTDAVESISDTVQKGTAEMKVLGEGRHRFLFTVTDDTGTDTCFEIHSDKEKVGEALLDLGLIAGDEGEFGLYVKTVNGKTFDYDTDGKYWAFYENGQYASAGVDMTDITDGMSYAFKVE